MSSAGRPSPAALAWLERVVRPWIRVAHRPTMNGAERLARSQPYMLVANHSAGLAVAEVFAFACMYAERVGTDYPLAGFAHHRVIDVWPFAPMLRGLGAVPSTYEAARATLAEGVSLLVFPGGDHEVLRPIWRAGEVDFNNRVGFLRIAREARVPIIPMGISGSHYTVPMLWRSRLLANLLVVPRVVGIKRWGLSLLGTVGAVGIMAAPWSLPLRLALTWAWLASPFIFVPIVPWSIHFEVGTPLTPEELFDDGDDLEPALERVQSAVQALVR